MPEVPVLVQVLHVGVDHVGGLERLAGLEGALDGAPGLEVAHPDAVERLTLTWLDELVVDHGVRIAVEQDFETAADLAGGVTGHAYLVLAGRALPGPNRAAYDNGIAPPPPARCSALADSARSRTQMGSARVVKSPAIWCAHRRPACPSRTPFRSSC